MRRRRGERCVRMTHVSRPCTHDKTWLARGTPAPSPSPSPFPFPFPSPPHTVAGPRHQGVCGEREVCDCRGGEHAFQDYPQGGPQQYGDVLRQRHGVRAAHHVQGVWARLREGPHYVSGGPGRPQGLLLLGISCLPCGFAPACPVSEQVETTGDNICLVPSG